jgi:hypothetical protein
MVDTWWSTVLGEMCSRAPMRALVSPAASSAVISASRARKFVLRERARGERAKKLSR